MKVAFFKGTGIIDLLIRFYTFSKYSHCELLFNDGSWFGCKPNGDTKTNYRSRIINDKWDFIELNITLEEEKKIKIWCDNEVGCSYDWKGIFLSQILPFGEQSRDKWFCSEICVEALQVIGKLLGITSWKISPGKLYKLLTK